MITEDLYQVLEIEESASSQEVRRAYYRLAKFYHPDLHLAGGEDTTEKFLAIQQAYEVLAASDKRAKYDEERKAAQRQAESKDTSPAGSAKKTKKGNHKSNKSVAAPPAGPSLAEARNARAGYMKAELLVERGDVETAVRVMQAVVKTVPDEPEYMSLYGYALGMAGERLHHARDMCRRALEAEPYNLEFKARLGYVYMRAGLNKTADEYFRAVLNAAPDHPIASVYGNGKGPKQSGGLLGGLKSLFKRG